MIPKAKLVKIKDSTNDYIGIVDGYKNGYNMIRGYDSIKKIHIKGSSFLFRDDELEIIE